jgi:cyclic beta-1,2-glucan synthetase
MYRLATESLLGLAREGDRLRFSPCLPRDWSGFDMRYSHGEATYEIVVHQRVGEAAPRVTLDGVVQPDGSVPLVDDGATHRVEVHA